MTRTTAALGRRAAGTCRLTVARAQTPSSARPGPDRDIMPALLQEVRGLRAAMEQMTSAGSRVQLALGRLQLQEQRLNAANGRSTEIRSQLAGATAPRRRDAGTGRRARRHAGGPARDAASPRRIHCRADAPRLITEEMQMSSVQRERQANADVQRLYDPGSDARQRRLDRAGALVGSQSAARRSRTIAPSR